MKKNLNLVAIFIAALALGTSAVTAAPFTPGGFVVYRVGDGTAASITNIGSPVFLDEYDINGNPIQSIPISTNSFSSDEASITEGFLTLSADGQSIVLAGYGTNRASVALSGTDGSDVPRVIARIDANGNVDVSTRLTDYADGGTPRGVASTDGNSLWAVGSGAGNQQFTTLGGTTSSVVSVSVPTPRTISIFNNQLYGSAASSTFRFYTIGSGLPTTGGQICTDLPGTPTNDSPYAFVMFNMNGGSNPDTLYIADDGSLTPLADDAIYKWTLVGGTWVSNGFTQVGAPPEDSEVRGLTGKLEISGTTTNVHLYMTASGTLSGSGIMNDWLDSAGFGQPPTDNGGPISAVNFSFNAAANTTFRGIAFVPNHSATPALTVSASGAFNSSGFVGGPFSPNNVVYTLSNTGTTGAGSLNWTVNKTASWLSLSATSGSLAPGASTTVTVSLNGSANSLTPGSYTDTIGFTNTTNHAGDSTRPVILAVAQFGVTPTSGFASIGPVAGPFNPISTIYTLTNGSSSVSLTWGASLVDPSQTWLSLSSTSGTLAPNSIANVTVSINANANTLPRGLVTDKIAFTNLVSDPGNTTRNVSLSVGGGFTAGNLVVYRVGPGSGALNTSGTPVFMDEYDKTTGLLVQSIPVSTNIFCADGTATTEGLMTRSANGQFLMFAGYATNSIAPATSIQTTTGTAIPRIAGRIDANGNVDLSTALTDFDSGSNPRGVASTDGNNIWLSGPANGIRYATLGGTISTQLTTSVTNCRGVNIFNNQVFFSAASVGYRIANFLTNALPTTSGQIATNLPGLNANFPVNAGSSYGFLLLKLNSGGVDPLDTLYIADDGSGIYKWTLHSGTWTSNGFVAVSAPRSLVGNVEISGVQTNVHLYFSINATTSANTLGDLIDTNGFGNAPSGPGTSFSAAVPTAPANSAFRGIAFAPLVSAAGNLTVTPAVSFGSSGVMGGPFTPANKVYTLSNTGGGTLTWTATKSATWFDLSATSGTLLGGAATNITVSFNANANSLQAGTFSDTINFVNSLNSSGNTTRLISLSVTQMVVTAANSLNSRGPVGGPFTPSSASETFSNASGSFFLSWGVGSSASWLTPSVPAGNVGPHGTASVNANVNTGVANTLAHGVYAATLSITNSTAAGNPGDPGNVAVPCSLTVGFGFNDDFSTFASGNLVGQQNWYELSGSSTLPLKVSGGKVVIPSGQTVDNEDAVRDFAQTNVTLFAGVTMNLTNAPSGAANTNAAFIFSLFTSNNANGFQDARVNAHDDGTGHYLLGLRFNNSSSNSYVFGSALNYFTNYIVIVQASVTNDGSGAVYTNMTLFVSNPAVGPSTNVASPYVTQFCTGPTDTTMGGFDISQFASATVLNSGVFISKACVEATIAQAYTDLIPNAVSTDPFTTWQNQYFNAGELANPSYSGPNADPLGKGMSNTNQFLAGFNPTNASAYVHITAISKVNAGTDIRVDYLGASGDSPRLASRTNVLEFTAGAAGNYNSNSFASTGVTNILSGGVGLGTQTNMVDPGGATHTPARYYRVRVLVP